MAGPLIQDEFPTLVKRFEAAATPPKWRSEVGGGVVVRTDGTVFDNREEARASARSENWQRVEDWKRKLVSFMEGLQLLVGSEEVNPSREWTRPGPAGTGTANDRGRASSADKTARHRRSASWDETRRRLLDWTDSKGQAELLAAQVLHDEGYTDYDPSHPLGGPDGGKDALCRKGRKKVLVAVHFPQGQKRFSETKRKFLSDLRGVRPNQAEGFVFVANQALTNAERKSLQTAARRIPVTIYHLMRITTILDRPRMGAVRRQFLNIDFDPSVREALGALVAPGRGESEIREAIIGVGAAQEELLTRGVEAGQSRCTSCGSTDVRKRSGVHDDRLFIVWTCGECGAHLGDCV